MSVSNLKLIYRDPRKLRRDPRNARTHSAEQIVLIRSLMREYGVTNPLLLKDDDETIGAGNGRHEAIEGFLNDGEAIPGCADGLIPTISLYGLTPAQWRAYAIADNQSALVGAGWNLDALSLEIGELKALGFDIALTGFDGPSLSGLGLNFDLPGGSSGSAPPTSTPGSLAERFGVPPFSVLNAREGWWQDRKRAWISLGIKSELGRGEGATYNSETIVEPGLNHYRNKAKAFNDGAVKGGLADQVAASATARTAAKAAVV